MEVAFEEMSDSSRIWVYQSNKKFDEYQTTQIEKYCSDFLAHWAAHGSPLKGAFKILHDKFIVISIDENFNKASGCSIDASVALIKQIEQDLDIDLFDRTRVSFMIEDEIFDSPIHHLKTLVAEGKIHKETLAFNNLVSDIKGLRDSWIVPAQDTWVKRYF